MKRSGYITEVHHIDGDGEDDWLQRCMFEVVYV